MDSTTGANGRIDLELDEGIAEVRFADPDRRNCLSVELLEDLYDALSSIDDRLDDVTAILLTHEGPVFSSGLDLDVMLNPEERADERDRIYQLYDPVFGWLRNVDRPVVTASKGPAVASGGGFITLGDINVASPDFAVWWPEINVGEFSRTMGPRFIKHFGPRRAAELTFLGDDARLSAEEAHETGLINRIVDADEVDDMARDIAETLAENQRRYGFLIDAYEVFNIAKYEHTATGPVTRARAGWKGVQDQWFGGDRPTDPDTGQFLGRRDDPRDSS